MKKTLTFENEAINSWYIVLPNWTGGHGALAMVAGADILLGVLAKGKRFITLTINVDDNKGNFKAPKLFDFRLVSTGGGNYIVTDVWRGRYDHIDNFPFWLCGVTTFVFGNYPKEMYVTVDNISDTYNGETEDLQTKITFRGILTYIKSKVKQWAS